MFARQTTALLGLLLTVGCGGAECDTVWFADFDGDGYGDRSRKKASCEAPPAYVNNALDCDDTQNERNPGREEIACDGLDNDCNGEVDDEDAPIWYLDRDADGFGDLGVQFGSCEEVPGYTLQSGDCDDLDPARYPGNTEICDGIDNDCDGGVDDGVPLDFNWYRDGDGDGFGDPFLIATGCLSPPGFVADNTDCDDDDGSVFPLAFEYCDGVDNDCDLLVDDADPDGVVDGMLVYLDFDLDGFGQPLQIGQACDVQPGWSDNDDDCVDTDPTINPEATEVCGGGDENCNGLLDDADGTLDLATRETRWMDFDGDGFGDPLFLSESCAFPSGWVSNDDDCDDNDPAVLDEGNWAIDADLDGVTTGPVVGGLGCESPGEGWAWKTDPGDCDDGDPDVFPGNVETCDDGVDQDCSGLDSVCPVDLFGDVSVATSPWRVDALFDGEGLGATLALVDDLNGDGRADVVAGAPWADAGGLDHGFARVLLGTPREDGGSWFATSQFSGAIDGDLVGSAIDGGHDLTGDALPDLVLGSTYRSAGGLDTGAVWIMAGPLHVSIGVTSAACRIAGSNIGDGIGSSVASVGDVGGDSLPDLLIGGPGDDTASSDAGAAYLIAGPMVGILDVTLVADAVITGAGAFDEAGATVASAGDHDQDGLQDILIGAPGFNGADPDSGAAYLLHGPIVGAVGVSFAATAEFRGLGADARAGSSFASGADVDGDGLGDLMVGAPGGGVGGEGAAYLLVGSPSGVVDLSTSTGVFTGEQPGDLAGTSLALAELDGDLNADLVIGAPGANGTGAAYVFYGPISGTIDLADAPGRLLGEQSGDLLGAALAAGPDLLVSGVDGLLIGAPGSDLGTPDGGAIYLFPGGF